MLAQRLPYAMLAIEWELVPTRPSMSRASGVICTSRHCHHRGQRLVCVQPKLNTPKLQTTLGPALEMALSYLQEKGMCRSVMLSLTQESQPRPIGVLVRGLTLLQSGTVTTLILYSPRQSLISRRLNTTITEDWTLNHQWSVDLHSVWQRRRPIILLSGSAPATLRWDRQDLVSSST